MKNSCGSTMKSYKSAPCVRRTKYPDNRKKQEKEQNFMLND